MLTGMDGGQDADPLPQRGRGVQVAQERVQLRLLARAGIDGHDHPFRKLLGRGAARAHEHGPSHSQRAHHRPGHLAVRGEAEGEHDVGGGEVPLEVFQGKPAGHAQPVSESGVPGPGLQGEAGIARARDHQRRLRMVGPEARHDPHGHVEALVGGGEPGRGHDERVRGEAQPRPALRARGWRIEGQREVMGQVELGTAGQAPGDARRRLRAERHHAQAPLEYAVVERKERGEEIAAEGPGHLAADEGAGLAVGAAHLAQVAGDVPPLDRLVQDEMVQAPVVEKGHARPRARGAVHEPVRGRVAEVVEMQVRLRRGRAGILVDRHHLEEAAEGREALRHVVGDPRRRRRKRTPDREAGHRIDSVRRSMTASQEMSATRA